MRALHVLILIASLVLATVMHGHAAAQSAIVLIPHWQPTDQRRLEMVQERRRIANGQETVMRRVRRVVDLRVTSIDPKQVLLTWTDRDFEVSNNKGRVEDPPIDVFKNQTIELALSGAGHLTEIRNWELVRDLMLKAQDRIDRKASRETRSDEQIQQTRQAMEKGLSKESNVRSLWGASEGTYFFLYGIEVPLDQLGVEAKDQVALPIGNVTMECKSRIRAERRPDDPTRATFHFEKIIDTAEMAQRTLSLLRERARQNGRDGSKLPLPEIDMVDRLEAEADLSTGWVLSQTHYRKVVVKGTPVADIETISFRMLEPSP